jgi:hypothetical protein
MQLLRCPWAIDISGSTKVIVRGMANGPAAEKAAIEGAMHQAPIDADAAMTKLHCPKPCALAFSQPPTFRVRSSGSQNNPAFPIVGEAVVEWTIYPRCIRPAPAKKKKAKPVRHATLKFPGPGDTPLQPGAGQTAPQTLEFTIPCGVVSIYVAHNMAPRIADGAIVFDFQPKPSELCDCRRFGWIQHVKAGAADWRYDNGTTSSGTGKKIGARSNPTATPQPVEPPAGLKPGDPWPANPWYGASSSAGAPNDFDEHPTPQTKIGDRPTDHDLLFVTQLVCADGGDVLFTWIWGPVADGNTPIDSVPMGRSPPP